MVEHLSPVVRPWVHPQHHREEKKKNSSERKELPPK
jgi:hypothetical protein